MATTERGPMSSTHGVIGPLVYYKWKGIECVRTKPTVNKRRKLSINETKNRGKFAHVQKFLSRITPFIRQGFHNYNETQTAFNSAMSYNLKNAVDNTEEGNLYINHTNLRFCKGMESPLTDIALTVKNNVLVCTWNYDKTLIKELEAWEFRSLLLLIPENPTNSIDGVILGNALCEKEEQLNLLGCSHNEKYHVHIAFVCIEHSNRKIDSTYAGTFVFQKR